PYKPLYVRQVKQPVDHPVVSPVSKLPFTNAAAPALPALPMARHSSAARKIGVRIRLFRCFSVVILLTSSGLTLPVVRSCGAPTACAYETTMAYVKTSIYHAL